MIQSEYERQFSWCLLSEDGMIGQGHVNFVAIRLWLRVMYFI